MRDTKTFANCLGYATIALWSFSALFIGFTNQIPPLLLACLSSLGGFVFYLMKWVVSPQRLKTALRQPWEVYGLFFAAVVIYRGLFLAGLKTAPIIEANLLNYLWPLFIILFSTLLDHQKPSFKIYLGAVCCFGGVVCIGLSKTGGFSFQLGHILSIAAALTWALYSVLTRRFPAASRDVIGLMHCMAMILFYILYRTFETPIAIGSLSWMNWVGVMQLALAMSLGYSMWDFAMTEGDRETVSLAAYYTPLLSTFWLILFKGGAVPPLVWAAALFIIGGSLITPLSKKLSILKDSKKY